MQLFHRSETIEIARKKRSTDRQNDEDYWMDVLKLQEAHNVLKMTKEESATSSPQSIYAKLKVDIGEQFGRDHKISHSEWTILRGNTKYR